MKGIFFTQFFNQVENEFGLDMVDVIIEKSKIKSKGVYTAVGNYPYEEISDLAIALSNEIEKKSPQEILKSFGKQLFHDLAKKYPHSVSHTQDPFIFLEQVQTFINFEVKKLQPDAKTITITCLKKNDSAQLIINHALDRPVEQIGHGLLLGCFEHFKINASISSSATAEGDIVFTLKSHEEE